MSNIWHPTSARPEGRYDDIWFISPEIGWAVNSAGQIIHTKDGGKSPWSRQHTAPGAYLRCISFSGPTDGWVGAITSDQRLRRTQDGVEWTQIAEEILPKRPGLICGICAVSKDVVYASGTQNPHEDNTGVMRTTDGGRSWSELPVGNLANLLIDIYFTDEMHGWVVGGRGGFSYDRLKPVILYTADGGATWEDRLQNSGIQFPRGEWGWKI